MITLNLTDSKKGSYINIIVGNTHIDRHTYTYIHTHTYMDTYTSDFVCDPIFVSDWLVMINRRKFCRLLICLDGGSERY